MAGPLVGPRVAGGDWCQADEESVLTAVTLGTEVRHHLTKVCYPWADRP